MRSSIPSIALLMALVLACPLAARAVDAQTGVATEVESPAPAADVQPAAPPPDCSAQQELNRMDGRNPVPLLPMMAHHQKQNMRDHLVAIQEIVIGMSANDFDAIERATQRIGYSDRMAQMCTHMGAGAPGFTDQAMNFHRTADTITAAARQKDSAAVAKALGATLQTCTGCHATFRQEVVDQATWSSTTAMPAPGGRGPRGPGFGRGPGGRGPRCADPSSPDCPAGVPRNPDRRP